jgi:DNA polymerase III alpha subunit
MRESDDIRRAMGKKDREFLAAYQQHFVDGAVDSGLTESYAEDLWEELLGFADYCFNKSHSVAYSIITYATAYLKANFSTEFFCALMTVRSQSLQPKTWAGKAPEYINEAKYFNVEINPPSVNGSDLEFSMRDGEIYFGLNAIRDVGKTAARSIVRTRGKTSFKDIYDFLFRVNGNKVTVKTFVSLIKAGAFDKMGYVRAELVEKSQDLHNYVRDIQEYNQRLLDIKEREAHNERMTEIIDKRNELRKELKKVNRELKKQGETVALTTRYEEVSRELEEIEELKPRRLPKLKEKAEPVKPELQRQKSVALDLAQIMEQAHYIGCYIGAHPAAMIGSGFDKIKDCYIGQRPNLCGIVNSIKVITTRRGQKMAFMEIDDSTGTAELTVFSNVWSSISELGITPGCLLTDIQCKVDNEEPIKLIAFNLKLFRSPNE